MTTFTATVAQGMSLGALTPVRQPVAVVDRPRVHASVKSGRGTHLTQGMGVHPVLSRQYQGGGVVIQGLRIHPALGIKSRLKQILAEALALHPGIFLARAWTLVEGLGFQDLLVLQRAMHVVQGLHLHDILVEHGSFSHVFVQSLHIHPGLVQFLGGEIVQGLSIHPVLARAYHAVAHLAQGVGVQPVQAGTLLFRLDLVDEIDVSDVDVLQAVYHGTLTENVNLWVAYVDPGGGFTTWAVNTRTGAITEYQNYVFNSISRMGHKFIGADADGLWELDGDLDDGSSIPTRIKSGWMAVSGSKFTSFKAAYLGLKIRDDATDFILKLHSGDGREYVYGVQPKNMQTTKVHMGKGLRSRYFSFELVTLGADYDLDSVEFIPISSTRRV